MSGNDFSKSFTLGHVKLLRGLRDADWNAKDGCVKMSRLHPIIFSGAMVRAILEGQKTQTRRIIKPQPEHKKRETMPPNNGLPAGAWNDWWWKGRWGEPRADEMPYSIGDFLWVREAWAPSPDGPIYKATEHEHRITAPDDCSRWRSPIHMPRLASRLTLHVSDVRVQRVREITCADAIVEGIRPAANSLTIDADTPDPRRAFTVLWDSINAKRGYGWDVNPWVVALTFGIE